MCIRDRFNILQLFRGDVKDYILTIPGLTASSLSNIYNRFRLNIQLSADKFFSNTHGKIYQFFFSIPVNVFLYFFNLLQYFLCRVKELGLGFFLSLASILHAFLIALLVGLFLYN